MVAELTGSRRRGLTAVAIAVAPNGVPEFLRREDIPQSELPAKKERRSKYRREWVRPEDLNALTQPRDEFTDIDELATSIAEVGPISEIHAAFFDNPVDCQRYVEDLNKAWGKNHTLGELKPTTLEDGTRGVLIIIAGERRTHAYRQLKTDGCLNCQEEHGIGSCFDRHFPDENGEVEIKIRVNPDYNRQAVPVQEDENFHVGLKPGRLAQSIHNRWRSAKIVDPDLSLATFARKIVHKSPDTVRKALRYVDNVPDIIKAWVNTGKLKYGHALELTRMREVGYDDLALIEAALPALDTRNKMSFGPFKKRVDNFVKARVEQPNMLDLFNDIQKEDEERRKRLPSSAATNTRIDIIAVTQRLGIDKDLVAHGIISPEESALTKRPGTEALDRLAQQLEAVPGQLDTALRKATRQRISAVAPEIRMKAQKLLEILPGEVAV
jgi:hypothetical protein